MQSDNGKKSKEDKIDKELYKQRFSEMLKEGKIKRSILTFKIQPFLKKAENSILIAEHHKDIKPGKGEPKKLYWDYWAITISYYSMLYAAKAAILQRGYEVHGHDENILSLSLYLQMLT